LAGNTSALGGFLFLAGNISVVGGVFPYKELQVPGNPEFSKELPARNKIISDV
jgi:hypothetical protein